LLCISARWQSAVFSAIREETLMGSEVKLCPVREIAGITRRVMRDQRCSAREVKGSPIATLGDYDLKGFEVKRGFVCRVDRVPQHNSRMQTVSNKASFLFGRHCRQSL